MYMYMYMYIFIHITCIYLDIASKYGNNDVDGDYDDSDGDDCSEINSNR